MLYNQTTSHQLRATIALASIMAMRMLGLFMILPVFALYAYAHLQGATPFLVGMTIGVYGLTQALLQIPFGMLSDRWGRKPVITIGLLLFAAGSVVAALSSSIEGIIFGRALQGSGAIAAAVLALSADLTREEQRTKFMAIMGSSMGMSFMLALALGPVLNHWVGIQGIFWLTAVFALMGIAILHWLVPTPSHSHSHCDAEPIPAQFKRVFSDTQLLRLNVGILILHFLLTALFIELPVALSHLIVETHHWQVYLSVLIASIITMLPFIIMAEKYQRLKLTFTGAILLLSLSQLGFIEAQGNLLGIIFMLFLFFTAFSLLEATLPSLVSKIAPAEAKGTAMGFYSTSQFFGAFLGGTVGGWLHQHYGVQVVFLFCVGLTLIWFILALAMKEPRYLTSHLVNVGIIDKQQAQQLAAHLKQIPGVAEAVVILEEGVAYLKVDRKLFDFSSLNQFSVVHD